MVNISAMDYLLLFSLLVISVSILVAFVVIMILIFYCRRKQDNKLQDVEIQFEEKVGLGQQMDEETFYVGFNHEIYSYLGSPANVTTKSSNVSSEKSDSMYEESTSESYADDLESSGIFSNASSSEADRISFSPSSCDSALDSSVQDEDNLKKTTFHIEDETCSLMSLNLEEFFKEPESQNLCPEASLNESNTNNTSQTKIFKSESVDVGLTELQRSFLNISNIEDISQFSQDLATQHQILKDLSMLGQKQRSQPVTLISLLNKFSYFYCLGGSHF